MRDLHEIVDLCLFLDPASTKTGPVDGRVGADLDIIVDLNNSERRAALPLMLAAMVLVAACFSLRFFRMGGVQKMVSGGVAAGFVLYVATKLVNDLGAAGFFSATVAGWSPAVVGCLFGVYVLLHQEDG